MLGLVASLQSVVIGVVVLPAGGIKIRERSGKSINRSVLAVLLRQERIALAVYRGVGVVEVAVGLLLLALPLQWWTMRVAT